MSDVKAQDSVKDIGVTYLFAKVFVTCTGSVNYLVDNSQLKWLCNLFFSSGCALLSKLFQLSQTAQTHKKLVIRAKLKEGNELVKLVTVSAIQ